MDCSSSFLFSPTLTACKVGHQPLDILNHDLPVKEGRKLKFDWSWIGTIDLPDRVDNLKAC